MQPANQDAAIHGHTDFLPSKNYLDCAPKEDPLLDSMRRPDTMEVEVAKICSGGHNAVVTQSLVGDGLGSQSKEDRIPIFAGDKMTITRVSDI
jgi:hypothetical protein